MIWDISTSYFTIINNTELRYDSITGFIWFFDKTLKMWTVKFCYEDSEYLKMRIGNRRYRHHRIMYKQYHPEWDIEDASKENKIDHKNHNKLDNNISNLRVVTTQENNFNRTAKGYSWCKPAKKWQAEITVNRKRIYLGLFKKEEDAHNAYLAAKKIYHVIRQS
jgi:hypothetical protein